MQIEENASLKAYNSFGIDVRSKGLAKFGNQEELAGLLEIAARGLLPGQAASGRSPGAGKPGLSSARSPLPVLILGGGSNILFTKDFGGLVLKNEIRGIALIREDEHHVYVRAGAGESWDAFVQYCLHRNWAGIENLSLIPGSVGAAPMQNIGAYGVELKEVFYELEAWSLDDSKVYSFSLNDCELGYRDSVFKRRDKGRFVILHVVFRLNKIPRFHIAYGAIREELDKMGVGALSIQAISQAVIRIRRSKLPDPAVMGNAGSFFKNPVVSGEQFASLRGSFPGMVGFPNLDGTVKLAAAWMIEQCGRKGYRKGDAGCHAMQALVLVNYGRASGAELFGLSEEIGQSVKKKFGIELEREVNIV
jgi:UDP-N-acetylmuramate dehydrogenase